MNYKYGVVYESALQNVSKALNVPSFLLNRQRKIKHLIVNLTNLDHVTRIKQGERNFLCLKKSLTFKILGMFNTLGPDEATVCT